LSSVSYLESELARMRWRETMNCPAHAESWRVGGQNWGREEEGQRGKDERSTTAEPIQKDELTSSRNIE
jgi:hypothetical protein